MSTEPVQSGIYSDFQGLTQLRGRSKDASEETLREVASQFEALFIQMMLKSMREASLGEGLMDNEHSQTYQSLFDQQIAIDLSRGQGLGLTELMVRQLRQTTPSSATQTATPQPMPRAHAPGRTSAALELAPSYSIGNNDNIEPKAVYQEWSPQSPEEFVMTLWPHAQNAARLLGARPETLIAQAALETGWGQHMIKTSDGHNSFNLFGIKADARWHGDKALTETLEFRDGLMRKERAQFRVYGSLAESFNDYADFLRTNPRYRKALDLAADSAAFGQALAQAGYATDPEYSTKINTILNSERFQEAVSGLAQQPGQALNGMRDL